MIEIREARDSDADGMSAVLTPILEGWGSERPRSPDHIRAHYINHADSLRCSVAVGAEGEILGFQSLKRSVEGDAYGVTPGWGIIGSYVKPGLGGQGIGRALFRSTLEAARAANLPAIDASIGAMNTLGQGYYSAMGFETYREVEGAVCKRFVL